MSEIVQLVFARSLYDLAAVESAAAAYGQLATIEVQSTASHVTAHVSNPHPDVADLVDHFANHVLHATVTGRRRAAEGAA